jgi:hypothetical protein
MSPRLDADGKPQFIASGHAARGVNHIDVTRLCKPDCFDRLGFRIEGPLHQQRSEMALMGEARARAYSLELELEFPLPSGTRLFTQAIHAA